MKSATRFLTALAATLFLTANAAAAIVNFSATGTVVFNGIEDAPLSNVAPGNTVEMSFSVDSADFVDSVPGDIRAYEIDQSSFLLTFSTPWEMGLLKPTSEAIPEPGSMVMLGSLGGLVLLRRRRI